MIGSSRRRNDRPLLLARITAAACVMLPCLSAAPPRARAHEDGIATEDCSGCHGGGRSANVSISPSNDVLSLGQTIRFTISIQSTGVGGLFFRSEPAVGQFILVSGESTKLAGSGVTHASPKRSSGQSVTFAVDWKVPAQPGDAQLYVSAVAGNDDRRSSGDATGEALLSMVFGCVGKTYFADYDRDGLGAAELTRLACSRPESYAEVAGDCDDYDGKVHPGAAELCNARDDDCDGQVDEGLVVAQFCADADGDGHGVRGAATMMGCGPSKGYGLCDDDCNERDVAIYPGAPERCNYLDDNCDQRVDDGARTECGVGWCRRLSEGCNAALCVPGKPTRETCNALDDDCNGMVDEGSALCPSGESCVGGACVKGSLVDAGRAPADVDARAVDMVLDGGESEGTASAARAASDGCTVAAPYERRPPTWLRLAMLALVALGARRRRG